MCVWGDGVRGEGWGLALTGRAILDEERSFEKLVYMNFFYFGLGTRAHSYSS